MTDRADELCELVDAIFFFSSRRRHTRSLRDWSSDVCSSDLPRNVHFASFTHSAAKDAKWTFRGGWLNHEGAAPDETVTPLLPEGTRNEFTGGFKIGRASCRERVEDTVGGGSLRKQVGTSIRG